MGGPNVLIYILRRDLRTEDNPILHHLAASTSGSSSSSTPATDENRDRDNASRTGQDESGDGHDHAHGHSHGHGFTHLLPVYIFQPNQIEVSGLVLPDHASPYPPARSAVANFWRCGPHRARFLAQSVWDLADTLRALGSGLAIRTGEPASVVAHLLDHLSSHLGGTASVWMTDEFSHEERVDQDSVANACRQAGAGFKLWPDEKYFVDDRDTGLKSPSELPDVYTSYRKSQEPLRKRPRQALPRPDAGSLPPFPDADSIPEPQHPFVEPSSLEDLEKRLTAPLREDSPSNTPSISQHGPDSAAAAVDPSQGGETRALARLEHIIKSGAIRTYKETRNGLLGTSYSTRLSAFLAFGCISARQVHHHLVNYEDGSDPRYESADGYGQGENEGTEAVRLELLWRDYMRLCTAKFGRRLFCLSGFRRKGDGVVTAASSEFPQNSSPQNNASSTATPSNTNGYKKEWKTANAAAAAPGQQPSAEEVGRIVARLLEGTTGIGLIDASQRELLATGYTSNRARQNVASFLAKHLGIDWRYGAEWYEMMLVDYDVSSNWSNWQYVAGVGNDPRGDARIFNPIKQAFEYDKEGEYVRAWVPETRGLDRLENVFQLCTASETDLARYGLAESIMATDPVLRIDFTVDRKPKASNRPSTRRRGGRGRGGPPSSLPLSASGSSRTDSPLYGGTPYGGRSGVVADGNRRPVPAGPGPPPSQLPMKPQQQQQQQQHPLYPGPPQMQMHAPPPAVTMAGGAGAAFAIPVSAAFNPATGAYHAPQGYAGPPHGHHQAPQWYPTAAYAPPPGAWYGGGGGYRTGRGMPTGGMPGGGMHRPPFQGYPAATPPYYHPGHMGPGM